MLSEAVAHGSGARRPCLWFLLGLPLPCGLGGCPCVSGSGGDDVKPLLVSVSRLCIFPAGFTCSALAAAVRWASLPSGSPSPYQGCAQAGWGG